MDVYEALYTTRAMRRVTSEPIPEEVQKKILDAAIRAPSGGNSQTWRFMLVDDKDVLSLSSGGAVREYALVKRVQFRLHDKEGQDWMPAGEIVVRRSYTFNETQVLARDLQEQRLLREMQTDAVQQILRRLQAAKKPA